MQYAILVPVVLVVLFILMGLRTLFEYQRGVVFTLGKYAGMKGPGLRFIIPGFQTDGEGRPAHHRPRRAAPGYHHQGQRHGAGERGGLHAGGQPGQGHPRGRQLPLQHQPARPDHPALGAGPGRPGRVADQARRAQRAAAEDPGRRDRSLGRQGEPRSRSSTSICPQEMQRAMAKQAEAERERRAKVIHADGEFQASQEAGRGRPGDRAGSPRPCSCAICRP